MADSLFDMLAANDKGIADGWRKRRAIIRKQLSIQINWMP